jgi:hypothetical protein
MHQERLESFGSAITETYAADPAPSPWQKFSRSTTPLWVTLLACAIVATVAVVLQRMWDQRVAQSKAPTVVTRTIVVERSAAPRTLPTATPASTSNPSPTPTPASSPTPTIAPSPTPSATLSVNDAPSLVRSNGGLAVGTKGSCGGDNVTVDVRGFTRGCTLFGLSSSGLLSDGKSTALVVPVSTTEDIRNVAYGLLYIRSGTSDVPRYFGIVAGDGSGPITFRVQNGLIVEQTGSGEQFFTFDGHRIVPVQR